MVSTGPSRSARVKPGCASPHDGAGADPGPPLNVGVFVTSVNPGSPSQARLQQSILGELQRLADDRFRFILFSFDAAPDPSQPWPHHVVRAATPAGGALTRLRGSTARRLGAAWRMVGATGGRMAERLRRSSTIEPPHYRQLRDLDIRIVWNVNHHELPTPTPYIRTIWDVNQRIIPMYPEYSHARYGFDGLDAGTALSLARASYVITGTAEGKRQLIELYGVHHRKVRVIPLLAPRLPGGETAVSGRYILYPSRFWPHKNHVVVLEALNILRRDHAIDLKCVFVGSDGGNLDYVLRYAERLGVRDLVDYRGRVSEEELGALYTGAWALTYASGVGPDNLPPLEAMALGCPVVTADVPGAQDQFGDAALRFYPTDEQALAAQLLRLDREAGLRDELIRRGLALAARLPPEGYAAAVLEILDEFAKVARAWERCDSLLESSAAF